MANIKTHLNNIKGALYGNDVRGSIHDGIDAINNEVESTTGRQVDLENTFDQLIINAGNSNAEIVDARVKSDGASYSKLGDRLNEVDSQLDHNKNNIDILKTQYVNVLDYGADPTGVNDSYEAIQGAINSARLEKKVVYIPAGNYRLTQGLICEEHNKHYGIIGAGVDNSILLFEGLGTALRTRGSSGIYSDFQIKGDRAKLQNGIDFYFYGGHGRHQNLKIQNFNGYGIKYTAIWDSSVDNLIIVNCGNKDEYAFSVLGGTDTSNHTVFNRIQVELSHYKAIYVDPSTLSCTFNSIHSERTYILSDTTTHALFGSRCTYENMRIENASEEKPRIKIGGSTTRFSELHTDGDTIFHFGSRHRYVIENCNFQNVSITGLGIPTITNCTIKKITSGAESVHILNSIITEYVGQFSLQRKTITNCVIDKFSYSSPEHKNLEIYNSQIKNDIDIQGIFPKMKGCTLANIVCRYSNLDISDCDINGNLTITGAGSYIRKIRNCYITGDVSRSSGGVVIAINNIVDGTDFTKLEPNDKIMKPSYL